MIGVPTQEIQAALCSWAEKYPSDVDPRDYAVPRDTDGVYGIRTTRAIKSFQKWQGALTVDGICGPLTWAQLAPFVPWNYVPPAPSGNVDAIARGVIITQWPIDLPATRTAYQAAQAVFRLETFYARGWKGAGVLSHNWGAIQSGVPHNGQCPGGFLYTDTRPNADGTNTPYSVCFKAYATDEEGCGGAIDVLLLSPRIGRLVAPVIDSGSADKVAEAMHSGGYFEGYGATMLERITHYADAIRHNAAAIGINCSEGTLVT